ncbi:unnamed protein product [Mytilus coruscus]|uniref:EF-hand domain-containing protein n=1 Tax=Mytilus coruscus TaxID=42192 RepID=A0A6J8BPY4_MYTCO|nr:unnamed protein product [Mytilus coruscus]
MVQQQYSQKLCRKRQLSFQWTLSNGKAEGEVSHLSIKILREFTAFKEDSIKTANIVRDHSKLRENQDTICPGRNDKKWKRGRNDKEQECLEDTNKMKVTCILLLSLVLVCLFEDCEAWRRRRFRIRIRGRRLLRKVIPYLLRANLNGKRDALLSNPNLFVAKEVYDRYKAKKMQAALSGQQTCVADDVCGISCIKNECTWYCDNICNIMADHKFIWRGDLVTLPCKFSAYDYSGVGYFYPADLAFHVNGRGRESDNMMVFKRLDKNGDGKVSESEIPVKALM